MFCARCGAANPDSGKFCAGCGGALQMSPVVAPPAAPLVSSPVQSLLEPPTTSGKAIASLICGICFIVFPAAVAAIILGHLSLSEIRKSAGRLKGDGMAIAGLVLGYFGALMLPFVLIIAAIAIPNLLRARMAANEASAVGSLRVINTAAITYSSQYFNGFPPSMIAMDGAGSGEPSCDQSQLIDSTLATGQKSGYIFSYVPSDPQSLSDDAKARGCTSPGVPTFEVHADPVTRGTTGQRSFYTDQTGVMHYETGSPATADSPPIE